MAAAKDCHILVSYYQKLFKDRYDRAPVVNRHSARWGFDSLLTDHSLQEGKSLLDYYFKTNSAATHSLDWFLYNYEKLAQASQDHSVDLEQRARIRRETAERVRRWRERAEGNSSNQLGPTE